MLLTLDSNYSPWASPYHHHPSITPGKHRTAGLRRSAPEVGEAAEAARAHYLATRDEIAAEIAAAGAGKVAGGADLPQGGARQTRHSQRAIAAAADTATENATYDPRAKCAA